MDQIEELLTRGVANIIPGRDELESLLRSNRKLNIYLGIDPTSVNIHLGHAFPLRKLQTLTDLGHHVTFLIGDFTALVGDTSDKDAERPSLTSEQIENNFTDYKKQASKILDFDKVSVRFNSDWLGKLTIKDFLQLSKRFSLNDFISRELIKKRLSEGKSISLPETYYPVLQGYDSYFMDTDIQIGGTDQTFNMQAGRILQQTLRGKESYILSLVFLTGTDGRKMSKSWGNAIGLTDEPNDMFGKVMSIRDELIVEYFTLGTGLPLDKISGLETRLKSGENPMNIKKELARQIVTELHSEKAATQAASHFQTTVQDKDIPNQVTEFKFKTQPTAVQALVETKLAPSNSEAKRLIDQGGVRMDGTKIASYNTPINNGATLSVGTTSFSKILIEN